MAVRRVVESDISGEVLSEDTHTSVLVSGHRALAGATVKLDVSTAEAAALAESTIDLVSLVIHEPDAKPRRVVMTQDAFDRAFAEVQDMAAVLTEAPEVASRSGGSGGSGGSEGADAGRSAPSRRVGSDELAEAIMVLLRGPDGPEKITASVVGRQIGGSPATIKAALQALAEQGKVTRAGTWKAEGSRGRAAEAWSLA